MSVTSVMAFVDEAKAELMAKYYLEGGYKVIRIDAPDIIEMRKPNGESKYWYSNDEASDDGDYILLVATKDSISVS